jgi:1-aminocyclopropane-1-carboxylate deaminase/D-cysteine desulfhydrase-like pyridoxal-dependent ACC family enzyme
LASYIEQNYEFFTNTDLSEYEGMYIAIHENRVQFASRSIREVYEQIKKKFPNIIPFIAEVQSGQAMVL